MEKLIEKSINRRQFLKAVSISGVGVAVGFSVGSGENAHAHDHDSLSVLGNFVKISKDNTVTVVIKHLDKGQGVTTGLTAIVADELDADWSQMRWEFAPADQEKYKNLYFGSQGTGGSTSIANSWMQLRQAGAAAKHMLLQAAAKQFDVPSEKLNVSKGVVSYKNKSATFGELALLAAVEKAPADPKLKSPDQFTIIGKSIPRIDSKEKTNGTAKYTIDVRLPNMLHAVIQHAPRFGAKVKSVEDSQAKKIAGVKKVVQVPAGVAVLADTTWDAIQGRNALKVTWDESEAESRGSDELMQAYKAVVDKEGPIARNDGDVQKALSEAKTKVVLDFEFPLLAHASIEPLNCAIDYSNGECHIYTGSQSQTMDQGAGSSVMGLPPEKVKIHTQFAGGSFGRRATPTSDIVVEALTIAKAINGEVPINLQWTREDDMQGGYYRPMSFHRMQAGLKGKNISGWHHRIVSQSCFRGTPFEGMIQNGLDPTMIEGARGLAYTIPNIKVDIQEVHSKIPTLWWRSVGHSFNGYATEVFIDEIARKAQQDPVEFRLALLKDKPRHAGVLKLAAEKAGWGKKLPKNKAMGVAVHESFSSYVAQVAEVTVNGDGTYQVDKIVCAVDCGIAVTPDVVKAQMEGGIGFGLGACMGEKITLTKGAVDQNNYTNYSPMRIHKMPDIDVHIVQSNENPTGVGEPGTPPAGPAVANALRKFLKEPLTVLPWGDKLELV